MTARGLRIVVLGAMAGLLAACPGYEQEERPAAEVPVTEVGPTGMTTDTPQALPPPERVTVEGEGLAVEAVLSPMEGSTHVVLQVRQAPANATVQAALHSGTCGTPGPQVASLGSVSTDAAGTGRGEAHLNVPAHLLFDGRHYIRVNGGTAATGAAAQQPAPGAAHAAGACADLPARTIPRLEARPAQPGTGQQPGGQPAGQPATPAGRP